MRKLLAYIFSAAATCSTLWFALLAFTTDYNEPERWKFIFGLGLSLLIAIVLAAYGNSLPWKKDKE